MYIHSSLDLVLTYRTEIDLRGFFFPQNPLKIFCRTKVAQQGLQVVLKGRTCYSYTSGGLSCLQCGSWQEEFIQIVGFELEGAAIHHPVPIVVDNVMWYIPGFLGLHLLIWFLSCGSTASSGACSDGMFLMRRIA